MLKKWVQANLIGLSVIMFFSLVEAVNPDVKLPFHPWKIMLVFSFSMTVAAFVVKVLLKCRREWFEDDYPSR
ncbi:MULTISPECIES: hypothetical protein [Paenibacillus]|uniref:hypothetical protein n=1 Tax=Paenibacillus TaxID=44249 RepID=UPI000B856155|nr:hypothetical protein [Paenibacillus amylolyticus]